MSFAENLEKTGGFWSEKLRFLVGCFLGLSLGNVGCLKKDLRLEVQLTDHPWPLVSYGGSHASQGITPHVSLDKAKAEQRLHFCWQIAAWGDLGGVFPVRVA